MNLRHRFALFTICILACLVSRSVAEGRELSIVAQPGDVFHGYTILGVSDEESIFSMNDHGEIAFVALVENPLSFAIMTNHRFVAGAGTTVDGVVPIIGSEDYDLWINNHGEVAYGAEIQGSSNAVFLDDRLLFSTGIVEGRDAVATRNRPVVDDDGRVTFQVRYSDDENGEAWATASGPLIQLGTRIDGRTIANAYSVRGNGDGKRAFLASTLEDDFESVFTPDARVIGPGDVISGIPVTAVRDLGNINSAGKVTTTFVTGTWPDWTTYVAVDETVVLRQGDLIDGHSLVSIDEAQLSGNDELIVMGSISSGDVSRRALFAGDELILAEGQELGNQTVATIRDNFEVNHRGDVAFQVILSGGDHVLLLSTVPEPSSTMTIVVGLGMTIMLRRRT